MLINFRAIVCATLICGASMQTAFCDWTSFRDGGKSQVSEALPQKWTPESGIAWQRELPGYGQSTPVILGDKVFVTAVEGTMKEQCLVVCLELESGSELWSAKLDSANPSPSNYMASRAAPTPVVDSHAVYAFFESGDVVAVDLQGQQLWHRKLTDDYGPFNNNHGLGSSPAQNATHVFLNIEHRGPSYLIALDKHSGETTWKVERSSGSSWASPIVARIDGNEQVIVSSGGNATCYAVTDGKMLWTVAGLDGNTVPSPTLVGTKLYVGARLPEFAEEGSVRSNCCLDLALLEAGAPRVAWRADKAVCDYASPVVVGECTYFLNKGGVLYCVDSNSGEQHYVKRLGTECWGTPIVAGEEIYFFGKDGKTQVLRAGSEYKVASSNFLWDEAAPPKPESYVEHVGGGHGHGGPPAGATADTGDAKPSDTKTGGAPSVGRSGGPGGGMLAAMMAGDKDGDGNLTAEEIPADFKPMLARIDTNHDGGLDQAEIKAMVESFAARRADSQASARDPIVYGAAASGGKIVIRTGTRLYCVK